MKFYPQSQVKRILLTITLGAVAVCGVDGLAHGRWIMGLALVFFGTAQTFSLWRWYWEVAEDMLRSQAYGFNLIFPLSELHYAGPVRRSPGFPVSEAKDVELEIAGARAKRYARISDREGFLQQLKRVAPQAEVIPF